MAGRNLLKYPVLCHMAGHLFPYNKGCRTEKVWWNDEIIGITPSYLVLLILINRPIIHLKIASFQPVFQPYKGRLKVLVLP